MKILSWTIQVLKLDAPGLRWSSPHWWGLLCERPFGKEHDGLCSFYCWQRHPASCKRSSLWEPKEGFSLWLQRHQGLDISWATIYFHFIASVRHVPFGGWIPEPWDPNWWPVSIREKRTHDRYLQTPCADPCAVCVRVRARTFAVSTHHSPLFEKERLLKALITWPLVSPLCDHCSSQLPRWSFSRICLRLSCFCLASLHYPPAVRDTGRP